MRSSLILFLLQLWGDVQVSRSQNAATCRVNLPPIEGTRYEPAFRHVFLPDETLRVMCEDKYWISNPQETSAETTCNDQGEWTISPICKEITCTNQQDRHVYNWNINRAQRITLGDTVTYSCRSGYTSTAGTNLAKCTRDGWMPKPLCQEKTCNRQDYTFADIGGALKSIYRAGDKVVYICKDYHEGTFTLTCREGRWIQNSECARRQCKKLEIENAEFYYARKESYSQNEQVQYRCWSNREIYYTATCDRGVWTGIETCTEIKCTVPIIENGIVPGPTQEHKEHAVLHFVCDSQYKRPEERPSICTKVGDRAEWRPTPACEPTRCRVNLPPIEGTRYEPAFRNVFLPDETLRVMCEDKYWISNPQETSAETTCNDKGEWTISPICKAPTAPILEPALEQ